MMPDPQQQSGEAPSEFFVRVQKHAAWEHAIHEAHDCGWLHDAAMVDMLGRNPYSDRGVQLRG